MRWTMSLLGLVAVAGFSAGGSLEAAADGMKDRSKRTVVRKMAHSDAYEGFEVDPYVYRYSPRGYYPYYNSAYWSSGKYVRARNMAHYHKWIQDRPPYFKAWGHPRKDWDNRAWHAEHHGYIWRHHW